MKARVGRFVAEFSITEDGRMQCEWDPHLPRRGEISKDDLKAYVKARDTWLAAWAKATRKKILIVDV